MSTTGAGDPGGFDPEQLLAEARLITDLQERDRAMDDVIARCRDDNERIAKANGGRIKRTPETERNRRVIVTAGHDKEAISGYLAKASELARIREEAQALVTSNAHDRVRELIFQAAKAGKTSNAKRVLALELSRCAGRNRAYASSRGSLARSLWRDQDLPIEASVLFEYARADVEGRAPIPEADGDHQKPIPANAAPPPTDAIMARESWLYNAQAALWRNLGDVGRLSVWCEPAEAQLRRLRRLVPSDPRVKSTLSGLLMDLDQPSGGAVHMPEVRSLLRDIANDSEMYGRTVIRFENLYGESLDA
jgi:hypothetical protein